MVELVDVSDVAWTDDAEVRTGAVGIEMVAGETNGADIWKICKFQSIKNAIEDGSQKPARTVIVAATLVVTGG